MTIAITGATGQLGRLAIAALRKRGAANLLALVRDPAKAADLGVSARAFDYTKPETFSALEGVETLVLISSNDFNDRAGQHRAVIDAAKGAGVGRIIYTSLLKGAGSAMLMAADHVATEAHLAAAAVPTTILRNGWYTENLTGSLGGAVAAGGMVGAAGEGRISSASRSDYAEAIAVVATEAGHAGKVYELAGDTAFTMAEMAQEVSRVTGRQIGYQNVSEQAYAGILQGFGLPEGFANLLADADFQAGNGALFDDSHSLSRLIGRATTPMQVSVGAALI